MKVRLFVQGLFIFMVWSSAALAKPEMEVSLEPSHRVKMGEMGELTVDLKWKKAEGEYLFTKPQFSLEGMKVEEVGESNEIFQKEGESWSRKTFRFHLRPLQPGVAKISSLRVKFLSPGDPAGEFLEEDGGELKIVPDRSRLYRGLGVVTGILALGGVLGWFFLVRSGGKKTQETIEPFSLEDRYVSSLNEASLSKDTSQGGKIFLSYLIEKYALDAGPMTRGIVERLRGKAGAEDLKTLKTVFERLDESRYARGRSESETRDLYREMIHFVEGKKVVGT